MQWSVELSDGREGCNSNIITSTGGRCGGDSAVFHWAVGSDLVLQRVTGSATESRMPTRCDAVPRYPNPHWSLAFSIVPAWRFCAFVRAGSWSGQRHHQICSEHHQHRNKQRYWQPCILFTVALSCLHVFKLLIFSWLVSKMVFADRGETISGGNFHGEYPAKVRMILFFSVLVVVFSWLVASLFLFW